MVKLIPYIDYKRAYIYFYVSIANISMQDPRRGNPFRDGAVSTKRPIYVRFYTRVASSLLEGERRIDYHPDR